MAENEPKLRHEFVGMMFALTIGEIGLQTAALVQAGHWIHFLPAYAHLFLGTFVVAASWVGWSRSVAPGARQDVLGMFEWAFVVLLLDMAMVVTYFILVRTVDFTPEGHQRIDSASTVAGWHVLIFFLYVMWDVVTKIFMYRPKANVTWLRGSGLRMVPTVICLVASLFVWHQFEGADDVHRLSADVALLSLVVLFRALKNLVSAIWPPHQERPSLVGVRSLASPQMGPSLRT